MLERVLYMFYEQLIKLCNYNGIKPTRLAKNLRFSPSNIKRWEEGVAVNSDTVYKLAEYFHVPIGYFFEENNSTVERLPEEIEREINTYKAANRLKKYPDFIESINVGYQVSEDELNILCRHLNCSSSYLVPDKSKVNIQSTTRDCKLTPAFIMLDILSRIPQTPEYNYLQVKISQIILQNLERSGFTQDDILNASRSKDKIKSLLNPDIPITAKSGLTYYDIVNYVHYLGLNSTDQIL